MAHTKESIRKMLESRKRNKANKEAQIRADAILEARSKEPRPPVVHEAVVERIPLDSADSIPQFLSHHVGGRMDEEQIDKLAKLIVAVAKQL